MHILMLSDRETRGGAATSTSRLATALCSEGHTVTRVVASADQKAHPWHTIEITPTLFGMGVRYISPRVVGEKYMIWERERALRKIIQNISPDVINVHNLHGKTWAGWSYQLLRVCEAFAPTVWTLHDMWSFTGRCAYNYDCFKFQVGCDAGCPTPEEYPPLAPHRIANAWNDRHKLFESSRRIVAVTPSKWLASAARSGFWKKHKIELIPYGLPLNIYVPVDRSLARKALNIDSNKPCVMIVAENLEDRRKGTKLFVNSLEQISPRSLTLITLGANPVDINMDGVNVHHLGYVDHERTKVLAYSAADIYVHPALADNLPNTVMEAIACGTPVVGFPIGGVPEMVRPGISGWLADQVSAVALAATLQHALGAVDQNDLRSSCRELAEIKYEAQLQARRYISLFESLTDVTQSKAGKGA